MSVVFGCDVDLVVGKVKLGEGWSRRGGVGWVDYGRGGGCPVYEIENGV